MFNAFKKLIVWQKSIALVTEVYKLTNTLPKDERFGLISQMKRSAISIPSNIAEGSKRGTKRDYTHFLRTALGSSAELETQLILAQTLYNVDVIVIEQQLIEIQKMLSAMIKKMSTAP